MGFNIVGVTTSLFPKHPTALRRSNAMNGQNPWESKDDRPGRNVESKDQTHQDFLDPRDPITFWEW